MDILDFLLGIIGGIIIGFPLGIMFLVYIQAATKGEE